MTENDLEIHQTNGRKKDGKDLEESLRGISENLAKLRLMLKEEIDRKNVKKEKNPTSFEILADRLEIFFLIFFFAANLVVTIIVLAVGYTGK